MTTLIIAQRYYPELRILIDGDTSRVRYEVRPNTTDGWIEVDRETYRDIITTARLDVAGEHNDHLHNINNALRQR